MRLSIDIILFLVMYKLYRMGFFEDSIDIIQKYKPNIKTSSIKSYMFSIKKVTKELFNTDNPCIELFLDYDAVVQYLDDNITNLASKKNITTSILVLLKSYSNNTGSKKKLPQDTITCYNDLLKQLSDKQEDAYLDNIKTEKEENNWITRKEILEIIDTLKEELYPIPVKSKISYKYIDKFQKYLILNLYTMLPPLRNDYAVVKVIDSVDEDSELNKDYNYIDMSSNVLLLCRYKTDKYYGVKKINIPIDVMNIISKWESIKVKYYEEKYNHNFLLINPTICTNMKPNSLTKYLNKIFAPKKVSSTLLRKIYLSEKYPVINTFRQMQEDSYVMGHNIEIAKKIYSKKN